MDPEKVRAIIERPALKSTFKVRIFHGLASFYQNFIQIFSYSCGFVYCNNTYEEGRVPKECKEKLDLKLLKKKVTKRHVLALLEFRKVFQMDCDAIETMIVTTLT